MLLTILPNDTKCKKNNKEEGRNVLFNDAFYTFYLWLYDVWALVNKSWYMLSCLWDDVYKRSLAANQKE